jgi:Xaa-Pro aminopeptidase
MLRLTNEGCRARRERLLNTSHVDVIVVNNPRHILYFCGLFVHPLLLSAWGLHSLLIDASTGATTLIVHSGVADQAQSAHVDTVKSYKWYDGGSASAVSGDLFGLGVDALVGALQPYTGKRVGYERGWLPFGVDVSNGVDVTGAIAALRRHKDQDEIALIHECIHVTEVGHRAAREAVRVGARELDVYHAVQAAIEDTFGQAVYLMGDFVGGTRAQKIGGFASDRRLRTGEVMILDVFPIVNGYRADFTATIATTPDVSARQLRLDAALHEAMEAAEALLAPNARAADVYHAVRAVLSAHGFADAFPHHAGHGLGLDHPEAPFLVPSSTETLVIGDVVTVEPGAYGADFAGRIEHNYLITETGCQRLTQHKTSLF